MVPKVATPPLMVVETFSGIEKVYVLSFAVPTHTRPACSVSVGLVALVGTLIVTCALAAVLERGV